MWALRTVVARTRMYENSSSSKSDLDKTRDVLTPAVVSYAQFTSSLLPAAAAIYRCCTTL